MSRLLTLALALAAVAAPAAAAPPSGATLLAQVFQDHAVLQRDKPVPVWGSAPPGSAVTVTLAGRSAQATADAAGRWQASLPAMAAGGPYQLLARSSAGQTQSADDILVGDVWLCSGQSNMEFPVRRGLNSDSEISGSANPQIRLLKVPRESRETPQARTEGPLVWRAAGPGAVDGFSAACFFMGRELQKVERVPMGLIDDTWGGTPIQAWLSTAGLGAVGGYDESLRLMALHDRSPAEAEKAWGVALEQWIAAHDPDAGASQAWRKPGFDDSSWAKIEPAGDWEDWGVPALGNFDGIVWMRGRVMLTAAQAKAGATLKLGPVDDIDSTWINGVLVGASQGWDTPRSYAVPPGVLKAGENVVAIRIVDTGGGGGAWGPVEAKQLSFADGSKVEVDHIWRYRISTPTTRLGSGLPQVSWLPAGGLTVLYNGMIAPLAGYRVKGVAWYQGEANVAEADRYERLLAGLFADWRRDFGADLPFLVVQLAGYGPASAAPQDSAWAALREAQRRAVAADQHAALALAVDIGDRWDIHPANKQELGRRLALAARRTAYGETTLLASGPRPLGAERAGDAIVIRFDDIGEGLKAYSASRPIGFELCSRDGACRYADAVIDGGTVRVDARALPDAAKVRFCWADSPVCNLYNSADLPAQPFELEVR
jgi:sialate O-acetylesterase